MTVSSPVLSTQLIGLFSNKQPRCWLSAQPGQYTQQEQGKLSPILPTSTVASVMLSLCLGIFPSKEGDTLMICCTGMAFEEKSCLVVITLSRQMALCQDRARPKGHFAPVAQGYPHTPAGRPTCKHVNAESSAC